MTVSKELQATLQRAIGESRRRRHEYITLEHVLLALCDDPVASQVLKACGVRLRKLAEELDAFLSLQEVVDDDDLHVRVAAPDRKSTRLNSSHIQKSRMPSSA